MKTYLKRTFLVLLSFLLIVTPTFAANLKVNDYANLLDLNEMEDIEDYIADLTSTYNMDIVIVTTTDTKGKTTPAYADDFYDENGYGYGANKDGVLLLFDMQHREVYISTTGLAISYLDDARIEVLLDVIFEDIGSQDYYACIQNFLEQLDAFLEDGIPQSNVGMDYSKVEAEPLPHVPFKDAYGSPLSMTNILLCVAIALVGGLAIASITIGIVMFQYYNPKPAKPDAIPNRNSIKYQQKDDRFVTTHTMRTKIPKNDPPSGGGGGGGGSSVHQSSSGTTHGGGGRGF